MKRSFKKYDNGGKVKQFTPRVTAEQINRAAGMNVVTPVDQVVPQLKSSVNSYKTKDIVTKPKEFNKTKSSPKYKVSTVKTASKPKFPVNLDTRMPSDNTKSNIITPNNIDRGSFKDDLESMLAVGSLTTPFPLSYGLGLAGSGIDLYDAYNADTPRERNNQLAEAALGAIPYGRIVKGAKTGTDFYKAYKSLRGLNALNKGVDVKDIVDPSMQYAKGGIIKDDRGQWAHPGEITEIGSNNITMQGVNYPVLGVSDQGDTQMMYPEQNYQFRGNRVTEYPMMQNGGLISNNMKKRTLKKYQYSYGGLTVTDLNKYQNGGSKGAAGSATKTATTPEPSPTGAAVGGLSSVANAIAPGAGAVVPILDMMSKATSDEYGAPDSGLKGLHNRANPLANINRIMEGKDVGRSLLGLSGVGLFSEATGLSKAMFGKSDYDIEAEKREAEKKNKETYTRMNTSENWGNADVNTSTNMMFPDGGMVLNYDDPNANAELELQETFQMPDGTVGNVDGPSHEMGGIAVDLPEGTRIWSDKLKHNGKTFAKHTKPITNKIARLEKEIAKSPNNSEAKENSIALLNQQLDYYFDTQETNKQNTEMKRTLREGGMIKRADGSYSKRGLWDNIRANKGSGKKPTAEMLKQERKIRANEKAMGGYMYAEGGINNPGFRALPEEVQENILANMGMGGEMYSLGGRLMNTPMYAEGGKLPEGVLKSRLEAHMSPEEADEYLSEYGKGGYTVRRSSDRKGKTHVVIGPDGTKKYFGDPNLGERGKSKYGKEAFYARHKKNLAGNPYFRAYARATWEDGGMMGDEYAQGGIHIKPENKGKFTAYAKSHGKGVQEMAAHIMANKEDYSPTIVKRANFAKNAAGWKHEMGGLVKYQMGSRVLNLETPNDNMEESWLKEDTTPENVRNFNPLETTRVAMAPTRFINQVGTPPIATMPQRFGTGNYGEFYNPKRGQAYTDAVVQNSQVTPTEIQEANAMGNNFTQPETPGFFNKAGQFIQNNPGLVGQLGTAALTAGTQMNRINKLARPKTLADVRLRENVANPNLVDYSAERNAIDRAALNAMGEAQRGFGSSAAAQAFKNKARLNQLEGTGRSFQGQENANTQIRNQFLAARQEAAMREAMMNNEIDKYNLENVYGYDTMTTAQKNAITAMLGNTAGQTFGKQTDYANQLQKANILANQYDPSVLNDMIKNGKLKVVDGQIVKARNGGMIQYAEGGEVNPYKRSLNKVVNFNTSKAAETMDAEYAAAMAANQDKYTSSVTGLDYKVIKTLPKNEKRALVMDMWRDTHGEAPTQKQIESGVKAIEGKKVSSAKAKEVANVANSQESMQDMISKKWPTGTYIPTAPEPKGPSMMERGEQFYEEQIVPAARTLKKNFKEGVEKGYGELKDAYGKAKTMGKKAYASLENADYSSLPDMSADSRMRFEGNKIIQEDLDDMRKTAIPSSLRALAKDISNKNFGTKFKIDETHFTKSQLAEIEKLASGKLKESEISKSTSSAINSYNDYNKFSSDTTTINKNQFSDTKNIRNSLGKFNPENKDSNFVIKEWYDFNEKGKNTENFSFDEWYEYWKNKGYSKPLAAVRSMGSRFGSAPGENNTPIDVKIKKRSFKK